MTLPNTEAPQAGWQRTLYILFLAQAINTMGFSCMFPFLPLYVQQLGSAYGFNLEFLGGMAYSGQALTMMLISPLWGIVADRYGRKLMVERAMFGGAVILFLMAFARSGEELVLLRAIQGLVTGTIAATNAMAASIVPKDRVGFAMGLLQVGMGLGIALGPMIGGALADQYGYQVAFFITAAALTFSGVMVFFTVKETFVPPSAAQGHRSQLVNSYRNILATPRIKLTFSMRLISQLGRYMILPVAPLFIQTLLVDQSRLNTFTGLVSGMASITTTLSSVYLGKLSDRIGPRAILTVCGIAAGILYFAHTQVTAAWQLLALQALVGITLGGIVPSLSALLARLTSPGDAGAVYGLDNSIDAAGRTVAPVLGSTVGMYSGLRSTFAVTGGLFLGMALLAARFLPKSEKR